MIRELLEEARRAGRVLATSGTDQRDAALQHLARGLRNERATILEANREDMDQSRAEGLSPALLDRLRLDDARLDALARVVEGIAAMEDPLGEERPLGVRPNGLRVSRRRVPLGTLALVYEARPNVTVEAAALAIKSGNALVLRGGSEALTSNVALWRVVEGALQAAGLPAAAVQLLTDLSRVRVVELLGAVGLVDLVIPRGGDGLMQLVDAHARVPVVRHGKGLSLVYLDAAADAAMAEAVTVNAKAQRPGVCNAAETLLVHQEAARAGVLLRVGRALARAGVELRGDEAAVAALTQGGVACKPATREDWDTEYLSLTMAVGVVPSLDEALRHIARHGTHHTASIITADEAAARRFLAEVDCACVLWNASTRFNDGAELGLGAELGISTTKLHAYGPMGLRELTAEKLVVVGEGQVRG